MSASVFPPSLATREIAVAVDVRALESGEIRGLARYTLELVQALAERSSVRLVGISGSPVPFSMPMPVHQLPPGSEVVTEQLRMPLALRRLKVDVLLAPVNRGLPLAAPCPTVLVLHDAVEWDPQLVEPPTGRSRLRFSYSSICSLASAARVITVSVASATQLQERLQIESGRLRIVYEGVAERFRQVSMEDCARVMAAIDEKPGYLLYLGGFDPKKDVATLLRAHARLGPCRPRLVLAGRRTAAQASSLEALSASLGTAGEVRFLGFVDEANLPGIYAGASAFVFPAVAEGFGLPVVEAMAAGTPVIVAAAGALPEVVDGAGLLFPAGDDLALAFQLSRMKDEDERRQMGEAARATSLRYSWESAAERTEHVLREAAALRPHEWCLGRLPRLRQWRTWRAPG